MRSIFVLFLVAVVIAGGWLVLAYKQLTVKAEIMAEKGALSACSHDTALATGLRGYLPNQALESAPVTAFLDADGDEVTLATFSGTGLVVNFWATWCPPCVEEMPALDRLDAELKASGGRVIAISADRNPQETSPLFYEEHGLTSLDMYADRDMALAREARVSGLPTTLLINKDGMSVGAVLGAAEWDDPDVANFLKQCLIESTG